MPKVMPKFIFMGGVALFALRRVVVVRIDGGESLLAEALSVALCREQQGNGCKVMVLSSSVGVGIAIRKSAFPIMYGLRFDGCPHVDDDCFVTKHTFLIHFGDPIPLQWDNSTIYLKHCGIYAFDASKKHSLPIWPRFSISLRSWDTGSATPCEDDHVTKKIRPNPSN